MKILLTTLNAKYIHKNLALRWLYVARRKDVDVAIKEYTIKEEIGYIVEDILAMDHDVVAFSVYIWNLEATLEIIKQLRANSKKHIIVGGPEVSYESFDLIEQGVDAICLGEGEQAFWQYIDNLGAQREVEVLGMYTKKFPNKQFAYVDLAYNEQFEDPYFLTFDQATMANRYLYFETSRGCPYACTYCLSSADAKLRLFNEDYVFAMLAKIAASDVRIVKLLDRTFNVHPTRALKIANYMNEYCQKQIFQFEIVAETLSEELITFFCEVEDKTRFRFEIGVQSFYEPTLQAVGRKQNNERLSKVISRFQQAGVVMHVDLIAGLPYEGYERFRQSFNTLYDLHVDEIQLGILKILKGTPLKRKQQDYGFVYNEQPPYEIQATNWLNREALQDIQHIAHAVEKCYNSGMLRYTIDELIRLGLYEDAFTLFSDIGKELAWLQHPYQPHDVFGVVKHLFGKRSEAIVDGLLKYDYFKIFKQKPKLFLKKVVTSQARKEMMEMFIKQAIIKENEIYNYAYIDTVYYKQRLGYQLVLYNRKQEYPKRWFIDGKQIEVIR